MQSADPTAGGANRECLNDYRANYQQKKNAPKAETPRRVIRVYDHADHVLDLDFVRLLEIVAPADSVTAVWRISCVANEDFFATGEGAKHLEDLAHSGQRVGGWRLLHVLRNVQQIIWGQFTGFLFNNPTQPWAIVRAIDSTFYEIETADNAVLDRVRAAYSDVREAASPWQPFG